jgi:hypothetical protein
MDIDFRKIMENLVEVSIKGWDTCYSPEESTHVARTHISQPCPSRLNRTYRPGRLGIAVRDAADISFVAPHGQGGPREDPRAPTAMLATAYLWPARPRRASEPRDGWRRSSSTRGPGEARPPLLHTTVDDNTRSFMLQCIASAQ